MDFRCKGPQPSMTLLVPKTVKGGCFLMAPTTTHRQYMPLFGVVFLSSILMPTTKWGQEKVSMARSPGTNQMATDTTHCTTPAASIAAPTLDDWLEALLEGVVVPVLLAHTRARYFFWNNNVDRMSGWPSVPVPALPSKTGSQRPILSCRAKQAAASFSSEYACRRRQKRTKVVAVVPSLDSWSKIVDKGIWASTTRVAALHNEGRHNMEGDRCQSIRTFLPNVFHPHFHPGSGPSANRRRRIVGNRSSLSEWPTQVGRGDLPAWIIAGSHIFTNQ
jgi:hypothetical protein